MTYGAGSVGLNLQFASYVFLFDRWWNPAVEDQAINRAHRIGAERPVTVTRFLDRRHDRAADQQVLERKRELFDAVFSESMATPSGGLSREEVFALFQLDSRQRCRVIAATSLRLDSQGDWSLVPRLVGYSDSAECAGLRRRCASAKITPCCICTTRIRGGCFNKASASCPPPAAAMPAADKQFDIAPSAKGLPCDSLRLAGTRLLPWHVAGDLLPCCTERQPGL